MDIRKFFGSSSQKPKEVKVSESDERASEEKHALRHEEVPKTEKISKKEVDSSAKEKPKSATKHAEVDGTSKSPARKRKRIVVDDGEESETSVYFAPDDATPAVPSKASPAAEVPLKKELPKEVESAAQAKEKEPKPKKASKPRPAANGDEDEQPAKSKKAPARPQKEPQSTEAEEKNAGEPKKKNWGWHSAARGGPPNKGQKAIPQGSETCLAGKSFVITGVLDSLEREEAEELIRKHGG